MNKIVIDLEAGKITNEVLVTITSTLTSGKKEQESYLLSNLAEVWSEIRCRAEKINREDRPVFNTESF